MNKPLPLPPVGVLNELLEYNPETGILTWIKSTALRIKVGQEAGSLKTDGYISIQIRRKPYKAHRIIWKMVYGNDPDEGMFIDHINRIKNDNRLCNLRLVTPSGNSNNYVKVLPNSGIPGIHWVKNRCRYKVTLGGVYYGYYKTLDEAVEVHKRYNDDVMLRIVTMP
jgi:hypothetical protein